MELSKKKMFCYTGKFLYHKKCYKLTKPNIFHQLFHATSLEHGLIAHWNQSDHAFAHICQSDNALVHICQSDPALLLIYRSCLYVLFVVSFGQLIYIRVELFRLLLIIFCLFQRSQLLRERMGQLSTIQAGSKEDCGTRRTGTPAEPKCSTS